MKAIVQDRYGSADVLVLDDIDKPVPKAGEVLVRVQVAGLDPSVWHLMTGRPYLVRAAFGLRKPKLRVRGWDFAGHIEEAGAKVTSFKPGDEVFGVGNGSFAEYVCAAEGKVVPKPANVTHEQAAAVPTSGITALQAVRDKGRVEAGQKVLVIGAGGGVGTFAVQLAKAFGAHVTGVCSTSKTDLATSLGADEVIDYTHEDFTEGTRRYDLIIDTAGLRSLSHLRSALTPRGTLVLVGGEGEGRLLGGSGRTFHAAALSPFVRHKLRPMFSVPHKEELDTLSALLENGKVTPVIDRSYPLSEAPEAIRRLQSGHSRGKAVIAIA
ncbi:NAD(P)-dependent alcohol dehydrogenase [Actinomadura fulvescens]|uniref:NAD(P)-dependent alcohol dehydrogenase n=1 Tax=Actinomadura fulvescens TaxID=46160 RepID=A0ABP6CQ08_9ACTN